MKEYGRIDLTNLNLTVEAIDAIRISDKKNVVIIPSGSKLELQRNRDFNFSGWVNAGKLQVEIVAGKFDYDDFKISLLKTKESVLEVRPFATEEVNRNIKMTSSIYDISGVILIDAPTNKSGVDPSFLAYPKLISSGASKIYYNDRSIYRGVYDSSRFYYSLIPFELDTLNDFFYPFDAIPFDKLSDEASRIMLKRYIKERELNAFGIFVGKESEGKVEAISKK